MRKIILYSTGCPACNVLKKKLISNGIQFEENNDQDLMRSMNFTRVPVLEVDGTQMDFSTANKWIAENGGGDK